MWRREVIYNRFVCLKYVVYLQFLRDYICNWCIGQWDVIGSVGLTRYVRRIIFMNISQYYNWGVQQLDWGMMGSSVYGPLRTGRIKLYHTKKKNRISTCKYVFSGISGYQKSHIRSHILASHESEENETTAIMCIEVPDKMRPSAQDRGVKQAKTNYQPTSKLLTNRLIFSIAATFMVAERKPSIECKFLTSNFDTVI